jgi:hypothetical protein
MPISVIQRTRAIGFPVLVGVAVGGNFAKGSRVITQFSSRFTGSSGFPCAMVLAVSIVLAPRAASAMTSIHDAMENFGSYRTGKFTDLATKQTA